VLSVVSTALILSTAALLGPTLPFAGSLAPAARAAGSTGCASADMYVVAHQDDSLLFQSPALLQDIQSGDCVRTIFLTAGDNGRDQSYWSLRERGVEAAYADMAGVANSWATSTLTADGHPISLATLVGRPNVSLLFMRLPDGDWPDGLGTSLYGFQSLRQLWSYGNPSDNLGPSISTIDAVDRSTAYGYQDLIDTLAALMTSFQPQLIATQNFLNAFGDGDHADHVATAYFTQAAQSLYTTPHQLVGYESYETSAQPENVSPFLLEGKSSAFFRYGEYDYHVCSDAAGCAGTEYDGWLSREYVAGVETTGVVANAGHPQTVASGAQVTLDGSASSDSEGRPLSYRWTQTGGPSVSLSGADSAQPSFTAPDGPAALTFSLVVSDGSQSSAPDSTGVDVKAPGGGENVALLATAAASSQNASTGQTAAKAIDGVISGYPEDYEAEWATMHEGAGATLTLSWPQSYVLETVVLFDRPNSKDQITAGELTLSDGSSVSFGSLPNDGGALTVNLPARPTTSLKMTVTGVSSSTKNVGLAEIQAWGSAGDGGPSGAAPSITSAGSATFTSGTQESFTVRAGGEPAPALTESGALPEGLGFHDNGDGTATLAGTAEAIGAPGSSQDYPLTFTAVNESGTAEQSFTLTVVAPAGGGENVALLATAAASSQNASTGQTAAKAIDGVISGYPEDYEAEWATMHEGAGATLTLSWPQSYVLETVVLFDRPNSKDQITAGELTLSDGSSVSFGSLPNDGGALTVNLPARPTTSLKMTVTGVSSSTKNVGLAEIQAWGSAG